MKKLFFLACFLGIWGSGNAQTEADVVRYSRLSYSGSARSAAMGGAFGALGGDISSWNINPGGIGVFRRSEVSYTSAVELTQGKAGDLSERKNTYLIGNLGGVASFYKENSPDWKGFNLGISYAKLANFNRRMNLEVLNSPTSLTDVYAAESQGLKPDELGLFTTGPFYDTYLLYPDRDGGYHSILETDETVSEWVNQYQTLKEQGYQGEFALAGGTNYRDKLYLGMVLGVQWIFYKKHSYYTEVAEENAPSLLDYYDFNEYERTKGAGVNLKLGVIYRPIPQIRLGASIHTPTWFTLEHILRSSVYSCFTTEEDPSVGREYQAYEIASTDYDEFYDPYRYLSHLRTPWRAFLSVGFVLGRRIMLDVDYEYVNYKSAHYRHPRKWAYEEYDDEWEQEKVKELSKHVDYAPINKAIRSLYRSTHNFRTGVEIRLSSMVSLRGGYSFQQSPFAHDLSSHNQIRTYSGGFGLNFGLFYGDVSYACYHYDQESRFYDYAGITAQSISSRHTTQEIRIAIGVRLPAIEQ